MGNPTNGAFAPLVVRDRAIGAIAVYGNNADRPFTTDDRSILQILANQAAIAVENDRLTELLRNLAVLEERERISKELHDGVIQSIYSVGLNLQGARSLLGDHPDRASQRIDDAINELDSVVRDVRNYIFELRPRVVEERGFEEAILGLVRELEVNTTAHTTAELAPSCGGALGPSGQAHVIQIVREILSNIARHAHATEVRLRADARDGQFLLDVEDNGAGFDPSVPSRGHGLRNMAARAAAIGGKIEISPRDGGGMRHRVRVELPPGA
jgi:signal transduction histidine kinase